VENLKTVIAVSRRVQWRVRGNQVFLRLERTAGVVNDCLIKALRPELLGVWLQVVRGDLSDLSPEALQAVAGLVREGFLEVQER